jgi:hypothetical protein
MGIPGSGIAEPVGGPVERLVHILTQNSPVAMAWRSLRNLLDFLVSKKNSRSCRPLLEGIHTYCTFIGTGRSGTTLIGALLDAHPNMILANQQHVLRYLQTGMFDRTQIYYLLLRNSRKAALRGRKGGGGYGYAVPHQWQGRFVRLEVIGEKSMADVDVRRLFRRPWLLERLRQITGARIRMIHVIRNPYDVISTKSVRRGMSLAQMADEYFSHCRKAVKVIQRIDAMQGCDVARIPVRLDQFIEDPKTHLGSLCRLLGVEPAEDYLKDCMRMVYKVPHKSRHDVEWPRELIDAVKGRVEEIPFLRGYSYSD